jgi:ATP-binding cassette subfamily F protein uup
MVALRVYAGGWTDYQTQRGLVLAEIAAQEAKAAQAASSAPKPAGKSEKSDAPSKPAGKALSFTEKHRLEALPDVIAKLEAEIAKLTDFLSAPDLFTKEPAKFKKGTEAMAERQEALAKAEAEWMELEERAAQ